MGVFDKRTVKRAPRVLRRKNIGALRAQLQDGGELVSLTSQHSMVIEDDTGLNVRLDINDALQAQAGNQIGSAEPPVMYAGQLWADTGTMKLKQRNSANTAWVVLGILDKTAVLTVNNVNADANGNIAVTFSVDDVEGAVPDTRKVNGHVLNADVNVTSNDIFNGQALALGTDNLNSKTTAGVYFNPANANATAANNYPSANAGALLVLKDAGSTQVYIEYGSGNGSKPRIFHRGFYSSVWSSWEQIYDTGNPPPAADLSAYMKTADANARFIQGVQLGAESSSSSSYGEKTTVPAGNVVTNAAYNATYEDDYVRVYYKPLQENVNGTWKTVAG